MTEEVSFLDDHAMNCGAYAGSDEECTCGLAWRQALATEQTMHRAWRKRAEEAEAREFQLHNILNRVNTTLNQLRDLLNSTVKNFKQYNQKLEE